MQQLAKAFPTKRWRQFKEEGWCKLSVRLSDEERNLLALVYRVALASFGVNPRIPATYRNAENVASYDSAYGWMRQPALLSQIYLATHPRIYRLYVGLYARLLLQSHAGGPPLSREEEVTAVRGCIELGLQTYNSKLALPSATQRGVSHLDVEWVCRGESQPWTSRLAQTATPRIDDPEQWRDGCETPAPQCVVFTSPSQFDDGSETTKIYSCCFCKLSEAERGGGVNTLREQKHQGSATGRRRTAVPYVMPRNASAVRGRASRPPPRIADAGIATLGTGPSALNEGDVIFFDHLAAHDFTQYPTLPKKRVPATVPVAFTRTAEYPVASTSFSNIRSLFCVCLC